MDSPNSLQSALRFLESGEPAKCLHLCEEILAESPGLIEALYLRGCAAFKTGDIASSVSDLEVVHGNHPQHLHVAYHLGRSLRAAGRFEDALAPLKAALGGDEFAVPARYELAICLSRLRRRPEAIDHYEAILELQPDNAQVAANLASMLERENRLDEAETWTGEALRLHPANKMAKLTRTVLDRRNGNYSRAAQGLRRLIPEIGRPINRSIAWNQLGQCLEGQEEWDEAFDAFSESNRILMEHHPGSCPDARGPHGLQTLARIREWLQEDRMAAWNEPAIKDEGGLAFLVGFPRSGTTLLDRMLQAHPDIEVLEEKSLFTHLHQDWVEPGVLEALTDVNEAQIVDARNIYRREMSRHRRQPQRALVIDKLPLNLTYLFLIHRLFPEAPIIFLQRHPMDACISCYFQAFELEASMGYFLDIELTAQYYAAVMQVASLSMDQIEGPAFQLRYEDLVTEPKDQLTALINFLELETDESMLEDWRQDGGETSNTPSYQQVFQPLHTRSIGKWRHFSKQLESSRAVLQPWVERFGYQEVNKAQPGDKPQ
jgi:tetratricopeptide (TPR) repeat protein